MCSPALFDLQFLKVQLDSFNRLVIDSCRETERFILYEIFISIDAMVKLVAFLEILLNAVKGLYGDILFNNTDSEKVRFLLFELSFIFLGSPAFVLGSFPLLDPALLFDKPVVFSFQVLRADILYIVKVFSKVSKQSDVILP